MSILSLTRFTILALVPVASLAEAAVLPFTPNNPTTPSFQRRQCKWDDEEDGYYDCDDKLPSLEQLVERMHDTSNYGKADAEHHAVFYTNLGDSATAPGGNPQLAWLHGWLKNENLEYYWVNDALDKLFFVDQEEWVKKNPEKFEAQWGDKAPTTFTHCLFQALSVAAINPDAYLFTKKGQSWEDDSIWAAIEYPALTQNPNIQRIWRADPRPPEVKGVSAEENCELDKKELLWERGRDAELPLKWNCPVSISS